jgi:hypothetical protein
MRHFAIGVSLLALLLATVAPARSEEGREGVPGRRVGGGTRWAHQQQKRAILHNQPSSLHRKFSAMAFASRTQLPQELKLRILYGQLT